MASWSCKFWWHRSRIWRKRSDQWVPFPPRQQQFANSSLLQQGEVHARLSLPPTLSLSLTFADNTCMASAALPPLLQPQVKRFTPTSRRVPRRAIPKLESQLRYSSLRQLIPASPFPHYLAGKQDRRSAATAGAYVTGQASDPISEPNFKFDGWSSDQPQPRDVISWGLLWSLLLKHKLRLGGAVLTLVGCSTCTLSMPLFSGTLSVFGESFLGSFALKIRFWLPQPLCCL